MRVLRSLVFALLLVWGAAHAQAPDEKGSVTTAPDVSIYFERYGSGPKFVFVPNRLFMPEFAGVARPDRTLILYDMRNRGQSGRVEDTSKITILGDIEDVEALRRHFRAEKVSLIGYSYLGLMVAQYATQHPARVERLVQIGAVPRKFGTAYPADQQAGRDTVSTEGAAAYREWQRIGEDKTADPKAVCAAQHRFFSFYLVGNPANAGKVPNTCRYENESVANSERHLNAHFADIQKRDFPREPFTKLELPVLTIHGTMDRNAAYGSGLEWATTFRHGRLISVPGGAHQVWLDDPKVLAEIDQFLAGSWPERAQVFGRE